MKNIFDIWRFFLLVPLSVAVVTQGYPYTNKTLKDCKTGIKKSWLRFENVTNNKEIVLLTFRSDYEAECIAQCYSELQCNGVLFQDSRHCKLMNFTFDAMPKSMQSDETSVLIHKDIACDNSTCSNGCVFSPPLAYRCLSTCQICSTPDVYIDFETNSGVTLHGATFETNSKNGRGIRAHGSSSWAELGPGGSPCWYAPGMCPSQALTLSFWLRIINLSGFHNYEGIVSTLKGSNSNAPNSEGFDVYLHQNDLIFKVREGNPGTVFTLETNIPSDWVYCTWVWRLSGSPKHLIYYEDGVKVTESNTDASESSYSAVPNKLVFGRIFTNRGGLYGNVEMDDLTIIAQALSDTEVMELYSLHN